MIFFSVIKGAYNLIMSSGGGAAPAHVTKGFDPIASSTGASDRKLDLGSKNEDLEF